MTLATELTFLLCASLSINFNDLHLLFCYFQPQYVVHFYICLVTRDCFEWTPCKIFFSILSHNDSVHQQNSALYHTFTVIFLYFISSITLGWPQAFGGWCWHLPGSSLLAKSGLPRPYKLMLHISMLLLGVFLPFPQYSSSPSNRWATVCIHINFCVAFLCSNDTTTKFVIYLNWLETR